MKNPIELLTYHKNSFIKDIKIYEKQIEALEKRIKSYKEEIEIYKNTILETNAAIDKLENNNE